MSKSEFSDLNIKVYSREEVEDENYWMDMNPEPRIGQITTEDDKPIYNEKLKIIDTEFKPKFRILLSNRMKQTTLIYLS